MPGGPMVAGHFLCPMSVRVIASGGNRKKRNEMAEMERSVAVYSYMKERANIDVSISDIARDLGYTNAQISQTLSHMAEIKSYRIFRTARATYTYRTTNEKTSGQSGQPTKPQPSIAVPNNVGKTYEVVGRIGDHRDLVRDDNGELFVTIPFTEFLAQR